MSECLHVIKDRHTGLFVRFTEITVDTSFGSPDAAKKCCIELTSNIDRATRIAGWGYALNAAMAARLPFVIERVDE